MFGLKLQLCSSSHLHLPVSFCPSVPVTQRFYQTCETRERPSGRGDAEQSEQPLILDGKTNTELGFHTADRLLRQTLPISHEDVIHTQRRVDTGPALCGPLAARITGRFKANYYKNKLAKHFLWCPLPRTT